MNKAIHIEQHDGGFLVTIHKDQGQLGGMYNGPKTQVVTDPKKLAKIVKAEFNK